MDTTGTLATPTRVRSGSLPSFGNIPATDPVGSGFAGYVVFMTAVTFDVPELVAEVAGDSAGYSALQAALTEAAIDHIRRNHPEQLADVVSRIVVEMDRPVLEASGFHGA